MTEIMVDLQGGAKAPLYEKIYGHIRGEIVGGRILPGEKLPSTRLLAKNLAVSRSTVEMAYDQLLAEGYIKAEPCRGFFVCDITELYQLGMQAQVSAGVQKGAERGRRYDRETAHGSGRTQERETADIRFDFSPYAIDTEHFPYHIWRKIYRNVLLDDGEALLSAGDGQGDYGLRCAIATYLHRARGVNCKPEQMILGAGNEYLELLLVQLLGRGQKVLMENPTYLQAYRAFVNAGCTVETVSARDGGLSEESVCGKNPDIIYMMPSHQFPMGTVMPFGQRLALLRWAAEAEGRFLIEDDHDSEYRYRGKPIPALQGQDSFGKVIYLGTFSKSIAPSLRISYMVLPQRLAEIYREKCGFYSTTVPRVQQEVLKAFIEAGDFERHLNRMRGIYRGKHDFLLGELKKYDWVKCVSGEHAGLHVLVTVESAHAQEELCRRARECGVRISGLSEYLVEGRRDLQTKTADRTADTAARSAEKAPAVDTAAQTAEKAPAVLLLGYGKLSEREIVQGLEILNKIIN